MDKSEETREKEIEEMMRITETNCTVKRSDVCFLINPESCEHCNLGALHDAGYRRSDIVKQEVVKEILQELGDVYICLDEDNEEMYARDFGWYKALCKKHGVEVKNDC